MVPPLFCYSLEKQKKANSHSPILRDCIENYMEIG